VDSKLRERVGGGLVLLGKICIGILLGGGVLTLFVRGWQVRTTGLSLGAMNRSTHVLRELVDPLLIFIRTRDMMGIARESSQWTWKRGPPVKDVGWSTEGIPFVNECGIQDRQSFLAVVAVLIFFMHVLSFRKPRNHGDDGQLLTKLAMRRRWLISDGA
jgi:hypothetical protein